MTQETCYALDQSNHLITVDLANGDRTSSVKISFAHGGDGLTEFGGRLYSTGDIGSIHNATHCIRINPADGVTKTLSPEPFKPLGQTMEVDPTTGVAYVIVGQAYSNELFTMDLASGTLTSWIGTIDTNNDGLTAFAIDRQGRAFATGVNGPRFYQIDLHTAVATKIAHLGIGAGWFNDIAFASDGRLWGTYFDGGSSHSKNGLYVMDIVSLSPPAVIFTTHAKWLQYPWTGIAFGPAPQVSSYCVGKANSLGCIPQIRGKGIPSVAAQSGFAIEADEVLEDRPAILIFGTSGRAQLPFKGGTLCVAEPWSFAPLTYTHGGSLGTHACDAVASIDFNSFIASATHHPELDQPGITVDCQWYLRDPSALPPDDVALSDALEFILVP